MDSPSSPRNGRTKVAFFSTKQYDREYFNEYNKKFDYSFTFFEARLNEQTVNPGEIEGGMFSDYNIT